MFPDVQGGHGTVFKDPETTVRIVPYEEDFDAPDSPTRLLFEELIRDGRLEAFLRWHGFDFRTVWANAIEDLNKRRDRANEEVADATIAIRQAESWLADARSRIESDTTYRNRLTSLAKNM